MDKTVDMGAQSAMYGGALTTFTVWGLQLSDWAAIVSAAVAVLGLAVHFWYTLQKNRRAEEAHKLEIARLTEVIKHDETQTKKPND